MTRRVRLAAGIAVLLIGLAIGVSLAVQQLGAASSSSSPGVARVGAPAPEVALPALGAPGTTSRLSEQRGKVVLLNFWATWCIPCRDELPDLQRLAEDLKNDPFALVTVDLQEDDATVAAFQQEIGVHLPVLLDADGNAVRAYGVRALPATFLIDKQGVLRQQRLGPLVQGDDPSRPWTHGWLVEQVRTLASSS